MKKVTEANFKPKSIIFLEKGVKAKMESVVNLGNQDNSVTTGTLNNKDEPHPDFRKAMESLRKVVAYDESIDDPKIITVKGIEIKKESVRITHSKLTQSGEPTRKSSWISLEAEDFDEIKALKAGVEKIKHEAYEYFINYKRMQLSIPLEEKAA